MSISEENQKAKSSKFKLLNESDFITGSPALKINNENATPADNFFMPNESKFYEPTINYEPTFNDDPAMCSFISGGSDRESDDLNSPAPKHIVLRNKKVKSSPFMRVKPPKMGESF